MIRANLVRSLILFATATILAGSTASAVGPLQFYSVTPCRLMDTRGPVGVDGGPALSNGETRSFAVYGSNARGCGIPSDGTVMAVSLNVTVATPTYYGHLTVWPYNTTLPTVSTLNFPGAEPAIANGAIVPLTVNPSFQISARPTLGGVGGNVHLIVDITGYFK
jgi:hypothetical protein